MSACHARVEAATSGSRYFFAWAGDADKKESDFLAVIDVDPRSRRYASVVATVPVGAMGTRPHHTDYDIPANGVLWANGFDSEQTFRFDLRHPLKPRLIGSFEDAAAFGIHIATCGSPTGTCSPRFNIASTADRLSPEASSRLGAFPLASHCGSLPQLIANGHIDPPRRAIRRDDATNHRRLGQHRVL